jgi:hypothetical protein
MREGYKLHEIDEMDIKFWFELNTVQTEYITADDLDWL